MAEVTLPQRGWRFVASRGVSLRRRVARQVLQARWAFSAGRSADIPKMSTDEVFDRVPIKVINLEHRTDRLARFSEEMKKLQLEGWGLIPASDGSKKYFYLDSFFAGSIACSESHIDALASIDWSLVPAAMICEDDLEFLVDRLELERTIREFLNNPLLSVLCLSSRPRGASFLISNRLKIGTGIVGRGCYLVKPDIVQSLVEEFRRGIPVLLRGHAAGKGDRRWRRLQRRRYFFAFPRNSIARQGPGYSDIEGKMLGPR